MQRSSSSVSARIVCAGLLALALTQVASAQTLKWCVTATGAEESPPVNTVAVAYGIITLDTSNNFLTWDIAHKDLTGNLTGAHLHGPAMPGQNAGVQIDLGNGNPVTGTDFLKLPSGLDGKLADLPAAIAGADVAPTRQAREVYEKHCALADATLGRLEELAANDVAALDTRIREAGVSLVDTTVPEVEMRDR